MAAPAVLAPAEKTSGQHPRDLVSPERITGLVEELTVGLTAALKSINEVNRQTRLLSLNARMEAARGDTNNGAAFGVIARAMGELAVRTDTVANDLGERSMNSIAELQRVNQLLSTKSRGLRLSDLALVNIDLLDRNLYERSCDVRWWATDPSVVAALTEQGPTVCSHASRRLGVILDSYTVYFDLVLCDLDGRIVANGRPGQYSTLGTNHGGAEWFRSALATRSGAEFGFEGVHESPLVGRRRVLVYSCAVRANGEATGKPIGVLGIVFNWDSLAQTIVQQVPLSVEEKQRTRVCICDSDGLILADTHGQQLKDHLVVPNREALFREDKNYAIEPIGGKRVCFAHARSPGFETYATGWHSVLICEL